jgi:hypothetical protein
MGAAVAAGIGLGALLPKLLCHNDDRTPASRAAFALLVVAWGPLMAFHLENIPGLDALGIHAAAESGLSRLVPALNLPVLGALQLAVIGLATLLALVAFPGIWRHVDETVGHRDVWRWSVVGVLAAAYLGTAAALVI